jgi:hypothetical protein
LYRLKLYGTYEPLVSKETWERVQAILDNHGKTNRHRIRRDFSPASSPFDLVKIEGLDFGSGSRDLMYGRQAMVFPFGQGWPAAKLRYLAAVFNGGCPWQYEQRLAQNAG